jgi:catechol 2,3-dioxygenase-like lactoylglutathione lyase family enzyme
MSTVRVFPCLCVDDVVRSLVFYRALLGVEITVDVGWYAEVGDGGGEGGALIAFVERDHASVPRGFDADRGGVLVSVVVDDAAALYAHADASGVHIAQSLREEDFGQRHFMVVDPDGFLVDVIETINPSMAFRRELVAGRRRWR